MQSLPPESVLFPLGLSLSLSLPGPKERTQQVWHVFIGPVGQGENEPDILAVGSLGPGGQPRGGGHSGCTAPQACSGGWWAAGGGEGGGGRVVGGGKGVPVLMTV